MFHIIERLFEMNFPKYKHLIISYFFIVFVNALIAQSPAKLRDPEFLVEQYNQLVAKHNALIEKTRTIILEKKSSPTVIQTPADPSLQNKLNEAITQIELLQTEIDSLRSNRSVTPSNSYLEETNARLSRQLLQVKADEQDLAQKLKELSLENRRLKNDKKNRDIEDKGEYSRIRNLELAKSTLERKSDNLNVENKSLSTENRKLLNLNDKLKTENTNLGQKLAKTMVDNETSQKKLKDLEIIINIKDNEIDDFERQEKKFLEDAVNLKSEVARLTGVEDLLNDRITYLENENQNFLSNIKEHELDFDAARAEIEDLRNTNNELKFALARMTERKNSAESLKESFAEEVDRLEQENEILNENASIMKGELSVLRSEVNSLSMEESRISEQLLGLRDANEMLLAKANNFESENNSLKEAIDLMRIELQSMTTNEQSLIAKVRQIDEENKGLVEQSNALVNEVEFFKDKARLMEIQLNQAIGDEKAKNEIILSLEQENARILSDLANLRNSHDAEMAALLAENNSLRLELNALASKEQSSMTRLANLENENYRLRDEFKSLKTREIEFNKQISNLNQQNNSLILEIDSVQRMKNRMRDDILGVIDSNEINP